MHHDFLGANAVAAAVVVVAAAAWPTDAGQVQAVIHSLTAVVVTVPVALDWPKRLLDWTNSKAQRERDVEDHFHQDLIDGYCYELNAAVVAVADVEDGSNSEVVDFRSSPGNATFGPK